MEKKILWCHYVIRRGRYVFGMAAAQLYLFRSYSFDLWRCMAVAMRIKKDSFGFVMQETKRVFDITEILLTQTATVAD